MVPFTHRKAEIHIGSRATRMSNYFSNLLYICRLNLRHLRLSPKIRQEKSKVPTYISSDLWRVPFKLLCLQLEKKISGMLITGIYCQYICTIYYVRINCYISNERKFPSKSTIKYAQLKKKKKQTNKTKQTKKKGRNYRINNKKLQILHFPPVFPLWKLSQDSKR